MTLLAARNTHRPAAIDDCTGLREEAVLEGIIERVVGLDEVGDVHEITDARTPRAGPL